MRAMILSRAGAGVVETVGDGVTTLAIGDRVGVPWLGYTCETCEYCTSGRENLCPNARFTGYQLDGGYAEYLVVDARYAFKVPEAYSDTAAHIITQVAVANLTRQDAIDFLAPAASVPIKIHVRDYPLCDANRALGDLRDGRIEGAAVLVPWP